MKIFIKLNIIIFTFFLVCTCNLAQDNYLDSLKSELDKTKDYVKQTKLLFDIGDYEPIFRTSYWDTIIDRCGIKKELQLTKGLSLNNIGFICDMNGDRIRAEEAFEKSIQLFYQIKDSSQAANVTWNLAVHYQDIGDYSESLRLMNELMKVYVKLKDKTAIGEVYNGLAVTYDYLGSPLKALQNYDSAYAILSQVRDTAKMANVLTNLATIHSSLGDKKTAKKYYQQSNDLLYASGASTDIFTLSNDNNLAVLIWEEGNPQEAKQIFENILIEFKKLKDNLNISSTLVNLAKINHQLKNNTLAENQFKEAITVAKEVSGKYDLCNSTREYANFLIDEKRFDEAISNGEDAYSIASNTSSLELKATCSQTLANAFSKAGNFQKAYQYQFEHDALEDSLFNQETLSAAVGQKFEIDYLTKVATDSVKNAEAQKVKDAELLASKEERKRLLIQADQEKQKKIFLFIGLGLALVFGVVMFNRFKVTSKQKTTIEFQKKESDEKNVIIEHQHKEISDSINYAEMIQQSVLPQIRIEQILPDAFVMMKPKDIVSGDFFWLENNDKYSYFAVADCTGHGIPGAFISMIGTIILNEIYNSKNLIFPNEILDELNRLIKITLTNKDGITMKDGMDICFAMLDKKSNELYYSGANNPLWIISKDLEKKNNGNTISPNISEDENHLFEIKADKQPVGKYEDNTNSFNLNRIQLNKGDSIYLFTDGYADQFGGPKGKKLMYKPFKKMLLNISMLSMQKQNEALLTNFNQWKGNLEQIDDVCIAGFKI